MSTKNCTFIKNIGVVEGACMCVFFFQFDMEKIKEKLLKVGEFLTTLYSNFGPTV